MQIIAYDTRPTKAKFFGNDPFNPTTIYLGEMHRGVESNYMELENRFIFKGRFSIERISTFKGLSAHLTDIDFTGQQYCIQIIESTISDILRGLLSGDVIIEDNAYVINFRVNKSGVKYSMEVLTRTEVNEILEISPII